MQKIVFIDFSLICYRTVFSLKDDLKQMGYGILRHGILKETIGLLKKYLPDVVYIACDDSDSWRKKIYPEYKAHRKAQREKSDIDWNLFYSTVKDIKNELKVFFPFKVINIKNIEADDIVSVLCRKYPNDEKVIITTDGDYNQLLLVPNTKIYNPTKGSEVKMGRADVIRGLETKILTGDKSDNIKSVEVRLGPKTAEKLIDSGELEMRLLNEEKFREAYELNKSLIDMNKIPQNIVDPILEEDEKYEVSCGDKILEYLKDNKLKNFIYEIQDLRDVFNKIKNKKKKIIEGNNKWQQWIRA
jgi:5'-3' exonuclease